MSFSCHLTYLPAIWKGLVLCGASLESLLSNFWGEVSADRLAVLKSWGCDATQDIPGSLILVTHWSGLVSKGIVSKCFCDVDDDYDSNDDDDDEDDDKDDDDYNGGDADRLITLAVTGCPLLRIGEKAMMLSHSIPDHDDDDEDGEEFVDDE